MLINTRGIVISTTKYSETSVIARIYTEELGLRSYMVNGVRKAKTKTKAALLQPLTLLDLVVYNREGKTLQRIKEMRPAQVFTSIPFDLVKSGVALFMSELMSKTVKEEETNTALFHFLYSEIEHLDASPSNLSLYPLCFMIGLSGHLGFRPHNDHHPEKQAFFDLRAGHFTATEAPILSYALNKANSKQLAKLLDYQARERTIERPYINKSDRRSLLQCLLKYYQYHIENFKEIKSIWVLMEVWG